MSDSTDYHIRPLQPTELDQLVQLCREHAQFEQVAYVENGQPDRLDKAIFGESSYLQCIVVAHAEKLVGYATFMPQYATWDARYYLYLDCLYLQPTVRQYGLGKKLMLYIQQFAQAQGYQQIQWQTPDFNANAIGFYEHLGALHKSKQRFFWKVSAD